MSINDVTFNINEYGEMDVVDGVSAAVIAIKNLLLSRRGNFPMHPSYGLNIKKYMYELANDQTLSDIKSEISSEIAKRLPSLDNVNVDVTAVESDNNSISYVLGISISFTYESTRTSVDYLLYNENNTIQIASII